MALTFSNQALQLARELQSKILPSYALTTSDHTLSALQQWQAAQIDPEPYHISLQAIPYHRAILGTQVDA